MIVCLDGRTATRHFPGIGRYVAGLVAALNRQLGAQDRLLVLTAPGEPGHWGFDAGADFSRVPIDAPLFSFRQQWLVPRSLKRCGAEVYHSTFYSMPYWPGIPTVLTVYDLIPLVYPRFFSAGVRRAFPLMISRAVRVAGRVIAISEASRADLVSRLKADPAKIVAIPLAPDPVFRPREPREVQRVKARHRLSGSYLLYIGSNKPHKNLPRLVEAWRSVADAKGRGDATLVLAGPQDPRYPEAASLAARLGLDGFVRILGPVPDEDLPALYCGASCFVFPSLHEGFGLPVIEAMACGTPVACSRIPSLAEVAGDAAILFDPNETASIASALMRILQDDGLRQDLGGRGLRQASLFSWDRVARKTLEVYRSLARRA